MGVLCCDFSFAYLAYFVVLLSSLEVFLLRSYRPEHSN